MTDRTYTVKGRQDVRYFLEFMAEAEMTMGDTVTIGDFTNSTNMAQCWLVNQLTGALLTSTISNNVVTMTNAGTNLRVIIFAVGIKA
jgi:hypothetical protein